MISRSRPSYTTPILLSRIDRAAQPIPGEPAEIAWSRERAASSVAKVRCLRLATAVCATAATILEVKYNAPVMAVPLIAIGAAAIPGSIFCHVVARFELGQAENTRLGLPDIESLGFFTEGLE